MQIAISDIFIGKRRRKEMGDVVGMAKSLKEKGQITPITVRLPNEEDKLEMEQSEEIKPYVLVAGGRRLGAAIMLGWTHIEAFGREEMDEILHREIELEENIQRLDMTWVEVSQAKLEILELRRLRNPELTQHEIAVSIGDTPATFSRDVKAAEILNKRPHLKAAGSRNAAIRASEMEQHRERLTSSQVIQEQRSAKFPEIIRNVVTSDARDFLLKTPPRSVDLVYTDPPFGIEYFSQGQKTSNWQTRTDHAEYDDSPERTRDMLTDIVPLWVRAVRETGWIVVHMNRENYGFLEKLFLDMCGEHVDYRDSVRTDRCRISIAENSGACRFLKPDPIPWIWHKPNARNRRRHPDRHAQNKYETILVCNAGKGLLNAKCGNVLVYDAPYGSDRVHPNQKSFDLASHVIGLLTNIGDTVMDTFFGSGVILAAASSLGRLPRGCDTNGNMRDICLGYIAKHFIPPSKDSIRQSEHRYQIRRNDQGEGVDDFSEEEPAEEAS